MTVLLTAWQHRVHATCNKKLTAKSKEMRQRERILEQTRNSVDKKK